MQNFSVAQINCQVANLTYKKLIGNSSSVFCLRSFTRDCFFHPNDNFYCQVRNLTYKKLIGNSSPVPSHIVMPTKAACFFAPPSFGGGAACG